MTATKKNTEATAEIVEILAPFDSDARLRIIQASMTLLGESSSLPALQMKSSPKDQGDDVLESDAGALPQRARLWMSQNSLTLNQIEQVFHIEDGRAQIIAGEIPGKNKKEKSYSAYILTGLAGLLSTGVPTFDDKSARGLCEVSGCYDSANHAANLKDKGNEFTGTKEKGWTLTVPGLKRAAEIVKEIAKGSGN